MAMRHAHDLQLRRLERAHCARGVVSHPAGGQRAPAVAPVRGRAHAPPGASVEDLPAVLAAGLVRVIWGGRQDHVPRRAVRDGWWARLQGSPSSRRRCGRRPGPWSRRASWSSSSSWGMGRGAVQGQSGAVEFLLQAGSAVVGFAMISDHGVDVGGCTGACGDRAHRGQSAGRLPVALGIGLLQVLLGELGVDRQDGEGVDLLVGRDQLVSVAVVVEWQGVGQVPGQVGVLEGEQREEDGVAPSTLRASASLPGTPGRDSQPEEAVSVLGG